jgi:hypothetical protein
MLEIFTKTYGSEKIWLCLCWMTERRGGQRSNFVGVGHIVTSLLSGCLQVQILNLTALKTMQSLTTLNDTISEHLHY